MISRRSRPEPFLTAMNKPVKITPMLQQYMDIKSQHEDAILFYRMGDFYEMFFNDAVTASRILGITLTSRSSKEDKDRVPMCGVPYHAASSYLAKLVKAGFRVAVCEQMEDPKQAKGVVQRGVIRIVTPGVTTEEQLLDDKTNRYLAAVSLGAAGRSSKKSDTTAYGLSFLDISTGEFLIAERNDLSGLEEELTRMTPAEILVDDENREAYQPFLSRLEPHLPGLCITRRPSHTFRYDTARQTLLDHFHTVNLAGFGCDHLRTGIKAAGALLEYIQETQKTALTHIERLTPVVLSDVLIVDDASRRNLELCQTLVGGTRDGSLLATMDKTCTPMGARLLKRQLLYPLRHVDGINQRLAAVSRLHEDAALRENLRGLLAEIYDLERLNSRVVLGTANARDLTAIKQSLARLPRLKELFAGEQEGLLRTTCDQLELLTGIHDLIDGGIREDAAVTLRDGNLIREGYNGELDELIAILRDGKKMILALEAKERERTSITKLKIGFNKVFGYYLEVSRAQAENVPDHYIRKQTLVNAERYITPELKDFENKVMGAQEKRLELEYRLFAEIRQQVAACSPAILKTAAQIAWLDLFGSLAELARANRYVRPEIHDSDKISISEGRHPVIEKALPPGRFVPNDIHLDQESNEVLIITGPNMAGKSTVLRQTALIVLMAQMGSFVPAASARIGIVDRIFTRVGAMDDLRRGQSTFMVEMNETANILNNATPDSLVILDEIGRGTSTYDGLAIAWAVAEELVAKGGKGVKTLFATHYHELVELAMTRKRVKNFNIAVREWNDSIIFLHKLIAGGTNRSYGIQVAALAGVPAEVVNRATAILSNIEKGELNQRGQPRLAVGSDTEPSTGRGDEKISPQLELFAAADDPLRRKIEEIQPDTLSPLEALSLLYKLKQM
jgi:DNA mismatch repair protein MutS